jgi:DNA-binding beta-propeller fold protein YncE
VIDGAINVASIPSNIGGAFAAAQNPVTNKSYFTEFCCNAVGVFDGSSSTSTTIPTGGGPIDVVVNPVTNKIYVANFRDDTASLIDGATGTSTTVPGAGAGRTAVNPVTNKIYIALYSGSGLQVIDGATNGVTLIFADAAYSLDVNPATNKIYVSNNLTGGITVIDGVTNAYTRVGAGSFWGSVAVNPVTNKIYAAAFYTVLVMDGATNAQSEFPIQSRPSTKYSVAVNPAINKIYIADFYGNNMTVLDGATNAITTVSSLTAQESTAVSVNPATSKIYLTQYGSIDGEGTYSLEVIDGVESSIITTVPGAYLPAVNLLTNAASAPLGLRGGIVVLSDQSVQPSPLTVAISSLMGNVTTLATPTFGFQASSTFAPYDTMPTGVLFQVDSWRGIWTAATSEGSGNFQGITPALLPGFHILYAYATVGQQATSTITAAQSSPLIGSIAAYGFLVVPSAD